MYVGGFQHTGHWSGGSHTGRVYQMRKEDGNGPISKKKPYLRDRHRRGPMRELKNKYR